MKILGGITALAFTLILFPLNSRLHALEHSQTRPPTHVASTADLTKRPNNKREK